MNSNIYLSGEQISVLGSRSPRHRYIDPTKTPKDLATSASEMLARMHQWEAIRAAESIMKHSADEDSYNYMTAVRTIALIMLLRGHDDNWLDMVLRAANAGRLRTDNYIELAINKIGLHRDRWAAIAASDPDFALALAAAIYPGQPPADTTMAGA